MGHLVGKDHANLSRGLHKNEERNNHQSVIRVDDTFLRDNDENTCGWRPWAGYEALDGGCRAEGFGAFSAGTDAAEMVVAIDAGGMAVGEADLDCVVAHLRGGFGPGLRLEHG